MKKLTLSSLGDRSIFLTFLLAFFMGLSWPSILKAQETPQSSSLSVVDIGSQPNPSQGQATPTSAGPINSSPPPPISNGETGQSSRGPLTLTTMNSSADKGAASSDSLITWGIGESAKSIFKAVGAFILVLVLLIICLKIIGSLARGRAGAKGARAFSLRGTMALDNRRYLAAVEVDGHLVIVGVSPEGLRGLASWVLEEEPLDFQTEVNSAAAPAGLKDKLELESSLAAPRKSLADNGQLTEPALALDEEPFEGPQTNDDFLQIDVKKDK